jgi:ribonuclease E
LTRRMLINAQNPEEVRIAVVDGTTLEGYQVEVAERGVTRGNIYRGVIAGIQPSLNAAFIDYGADRHGFLSIQDVVPDAYYRQPKGNGRPRIEDVLDRGRPIVVQVTKEGEGQKGAALTTNLSLAGRYLVLTPFENTIGVSRKVEDDEERRKLKQQVVKLEVPSGCGVIVRTNALDQTKATLTRDLNALLRLWKRIASEAREGKGTKLLYSDQELVLRALRDHLDASIDEVLVDDGDAFARAEEYMRAFMPRSKTALIRYTDRVPLFSRFHLEQQIDRIYERSVSLTSGGSIVIDRTEALTAIDVNSGRSTRAASQEETATHTNLEAAREAARQLRLRDIGGLVVIDFIDMRSSKNRRKVEKALRDEMKLDKARATLGRLSDNGLLEVNRQRIQQALDLRTHRACPTCNGTGRVPTPEMMALNLLRRIEARAAAGVLQKVRIVLHPEVADLFQNTRRQELAALEGEFDVRVEVVGDVRYQPSEQKVDWSDRDPSEVAAKAEPVAVAPSAVTPPDILEAAEADHETGTTEEADASEEAGDAEQRRPKRRRRGRRRGRGEGAAAPAAARRDANEDASDEEAPSTTASETVSEASSESTPEASLASGSDGSDGAVRRRRRGRRGGRGKRAEGAAERASDPQDESVAAS